jgi:hypothetical protein
MDTRFTSPLAGPLAGEVTPTFARSKVVWLCIRVICTGNETGREQERVAIGARMAGNAQALRNLTLETASHMCRLG